MTATDVAPKSRLPPEAEDAKKRALRSIPFGLYVVTTRRKSVDSSEDVHAFIGSWVMQCSFKPPMVAVALQRDNLGNQMIRESGVFAINFLAQDQKDVATRFLKGARAENGRLADLPYEAGANGCPVFPDLFASVECEVASVVQGENDHTIFVAHVTNATWRREAKPLTKESTGWTYGG